MTKLFHFHTWSKWSLPLQSYRGNKQQWRVCEVCHAADFRNVRWDDHTDLVLVQKAVQQLLDAAKT